MEDYDRVKALLKGSDMIFIAAGAGGGTGTGAAPVVARIAREVGALTVAIVTKPFGFEGTRRSEQAERGVERAGRGGRHADRRPQRPPARRCSTSRPRWSRPSGSPTTCCARASRASPTSSRCPGLINLDFADVRTIMSDAGNALLGIGMGVGENRATEAADAGRLLAAAGNLDGRRPLDPAVDHRRRDLSLWEVNEAAKAVSEAAHPDANIIFGAMVDEKLDDQVWVTVVATGYGDEGRRTSVSRLNEPASRRGAGRPARAPAATGSRARAAAASRWTSSTSPSSCRTSERRQRSHASAPVVSLCDERG